MTAYDFNKIAGALLGTVLVLMALHMLAGALFYSPLPERAGFEVEVEVAGGEGEAPAADAETGGE